MTTIMLARQSLVQGLQRLSVLVFDHCKLLKELEDITIVRRDGTTLAERKTVREGDRPHVSRECGGIRG